MRKKKKIIRGYVCKYKNIAIYIAIMQKIKQYYQTKANKLFIYIKLIL